MSDVQIKTEDIAKYIEIYERTYGTAINTDVAKKQLTELVNFLETIQLNDDEDEYEQSRATNSQRQ